MNSPLLLELLLLCEDEPLLEEERDEDDDDEEEEDELTDEDLLRLRFCFFSSFSSFTVNQSIKHRNQTNSPQSINLSQSYCLVL